MAYQPFALEAKKEAAEKLEQNRLLEKPVESEAVARGQSR
jgi:hypothetical protein